MVIVARRAGEPAFDESIAPLISTFADQATVALDKAARQRVARQLDVYEDRDRIARDLHDLVIQRVFAAGLALQAVLPRVGDAEVRRRVQGVVRQLDDTVRDIRTTIFDLQTTDAEEHPDSLRRRVLDIVNESVGDGLKPTVRMSGAVDSLVTGDLAADVEAVVREAVSNVARHAGAQHVTTTLDVGGRRRGGGRGRRARDRRAGRPQWSPEPRAARASAWRGSLRRGAARRRDPAALVRPRPLETCGVGGGRALDACPLPKGGPETLRRGTSGTPRPTARAPRSLLPRASRRPRWPGGHLAHRAPRASAVGR